MRLYIAGPMTGIPRFNFPRFESYAQLLRDVGFEVVSPHESDDPAVQEAAWASETGSMADLPPNKEGSDLSMTLMKNTTDILGVDGVALLDNWNRSPGVIHEVAVATRMGIPVAPAAMWLYVKPGGATVIFGAPQ